MAARISTSWFAMDVCTLTAVRIFPQRALLLLVGVLSLVDDVLSSNAERLDAVFAFRSLRRERAWACMSASGSLALDVVPGSTDTVPGRRWAVLCWPSSALFVGRAVAASAARLSSAMPGGAALTQPGTDLSAG